MLCTRLPVSDRAVPFVRKNCSVVSHPCDRKKKAWSAGIALIRLDDADAVIGEFEVGSGQFNFGHVAGDAVVF